MTTNKDYYGGKTSWFVFKAYEYEQKYKQNKTGACFDSVITWLFEEFNPLIRAKQIIEEADLSASCKVNGIKRAISGSYRGAPSEGTNVAVYTTKTEMLKACNKQTRNRLA